MLLIIKTFVYVYLCSPNTYAIDVCNYNTLDLNLVAAVRCPLFAVHHLATGLFLGHVFINAPSVVVVSAEFDIPMRRKRQRRPDECQLTKP